MCFLDGILAHSDAQRKLTDKHLRNKLLLDLYAGRCLPWDFDTYSDSGLSQAEPKAM